MMDDDERKMRDAMAGDAPKDVTDELMEKGVRQLLAAGVHKTLQDGPVTAKAALIGSLTSSLLVNIEAIQKGHSAGLQSALTFINDHKGTRFVLGSVTERGGELLQRVQDLINGLTDEEMDGVLKDFAEIEGLDPMEALLRQILDKGDPGKQDGPDASS